MKQFPGRFDGNSEWAASNHNEAAGERTELPCPPGRAPMLIACLHTAESNIPVFERAAASLGLPAGSLRHVVRADLLLAAEAAGGLTPQIARSTIAALRALSADANAV